jgi:hypothetical protein
MSKLRDRLRETGRKRRARLGFAIGASDEGPAHVLVVAEVADAAGASSAVEAGARSLLYSGSPEGAAAVIEAAGDVPVGCRVEAATAEQTAALAAASADFFLFDDDRTTASALLERGLGRVLLLDGEPDEERLRMLAPLDLDAILLAAPLETTTVRDQLRLRRIVGLARAPVIIPTSGAAPSSTLEVWRDAGAPAILVPADQSDSLPSLLEAAREVRGPRERDEERPDPLLPTPTSASDDDDEELDSLTR